MTQYLGFWYFWGGFGFVFECLKLLLEFTQKIRQGLFSSFWSYEPPFRKEEGEGEAVTDGWTDKQTGELCWAE